jgi:anti-sigma-K factor RskA
MSTDVHTLSGAYALDALGPEEAAEFRRHLEGCEGCRDEVRELQRAVARMAAAESTPPPPDLKARILAAADRTPQEPPVGGRAPRAVPAPGKRPARWLTGLAVAAAAVVIAGVGAFGLRAAMDDDTTLSHQAVEVFEATDAHTKTLETANGGRLTVAVSKSKDEMAVDTRGLPALEGGRVYQIWAVHGDTMVSAAILDDPGTGAAMGMPNAATEVALTIEPAGGSEQPTTEPIVQVDPYDVLAG